jgi:hypothetical protein
MISKRKKTVTGIFAPKNRKFLIVGVAAAAIGTYLIAGDKIKSLFKKDDTSNDELNPAPNILPPAPAPAPTENGGGGKSEPAGLDINKKLKKGTQGEEVKRLQFIINYIAGFRKSTSYKTPGGYTVNFPIGTDGDFGNGTQAGAYFIAPSFKSDGFITLDTARKRLAYIAGYYGKPFPSELVGTKNYNKYQDDYKSGQIDFGKDDRAKNIGTFVNPFNP